jgi:hypothetical protein
VIDALSPIVARAAAKMAKAYFVHLSKGGVIQTCDLENIARVRVLENLERIEQVPEGDERARYVYTVAVNAIRSEFRYIATGGDGAARLTPNGLLDTGAKDSSYGGGSNVFNSGDDIAPAGVQPAEESWVVPSVWDDWKKLDLTRRFKLLEMAGLRGTTALQRDGVRRSCAAVKWNEIPYDYQIEIESAWKQTVRGELRKNKFANAGKPRNAFGFVSDILPAPTELARITPPTLRATALLVLGGGLYTEGDGDSINSGEIAKILGRSERTIHRDNAEFLKLWGAYSRATADEKRDEDKFPRYPLHTAIADGFAQMPDGAQMPQAQNAVLDSVMMTPGSLRSLRHRMKKYCTDFGSAVVTQTIVTPKANIYDCGPRPSAFKIIAGFSDRIAASDGHSGTIDCFYRKPSPGDPRGWIPIVCRDGVKQPIVWLHNWARSDAPELFGDKPTKRSYGFVKPLDPRKTPYTRGDVVTRGFKQIGLVAEFTAAYLDSRANPPRILQIWENLPDDIVPPSPELPARHSSVTQKHDTRTLMAIA